jgi:hypothetical protein
MQLRFASFAVTSLRRDLHPQECAYAGQAAEERQPVQRNSSTDSRVIPTYSRSNSRSSPSYRVCVARGPPHSGSRSF